MKTCHICGAILSHGVCYSCDHKECPKCPVYVEKPSYEELETEIKDKDRRFEEHTKAVGQFLSDMYATMVDPVEDHDLKVKELCDLLLKHATEDREQIERLRSVINTPEIEDFDKGVPLEAAHQIERWGADHDVGKQPEDWFWLCGYLAGKALAAMKSGDTEKAKHHCISTAAAMRNWHKHIATGESAMRPGISAEKAAIGIHEITKGER